MSYTTGTWKGLARYGCPCGFGTLSEPRIEAHVRECQGARSPGPLAGLIFASDEAAEQASEKGLSARDFAGIEPSGVGGFTTADVRKAAAHDEETDR